MILIDLKQLQSAIVRQQTVLYDDIRYIPDAVRARVDKHTMKWVYSAELIGINGECTVIASIEQIELEQLSEQSLVTAPRSEGIGGAGD